MKNRFFVTGGGNFLVIPSDGSPAYFMTNYFTFERYVRERSAKYLSKQLPEVNIVSEYTLPSMIPWNYLFHQTYNSFSDIDGMGTELRVTFGRIFSQNKHSVKQIVTLSMIPNGARYRKVTLIGAKGVPVNLTLYAFSDKSNWILENDEVPVEDLGSFNCKKLEYELSYYINLPASETRYLNTDVDNTKIPPNEAEKLRREKVLKDVFKLS